MAGTTKPKILMPPHYVVIEGNSLSTVYTQVAHLEVSINYLTFLNFHTIDFTLDFYCS